MMYKVVCIESSKRRLTIKDEIYSVIGVFINGGLELKETINIGEGFIGHNPARFRPVDHSFGQNLAEEIETELNEQYLIPSL